MAKATADLLMKHVKKMTAGSAVDFSRVYKERHALPVRVPLVKEILRSAGFDDVAERIPEYDPRRTQGEWCHFAHWLQEVYGGGEGGGDQLEGGPDGGDGGGLVEGGNGGGDPRGGQQGSRDDAGGGDGSIQVGGGNGSIQVGGGNGSIQVGGGNGSIQVGGGNGSIQASGGDGQDGGDGGAWPAHGAVKVKRPLTRSDEAPPPNLLQGSIAATRLQLEALQLFLHGTQTESYKEQAIMCDMLKTSADAARSQLGSLDELLHFTPAKSLEVQTCRDMLSCSIKMSSQQLELFEKVLFQNVLRYTPAAKMLQTSIAASLSQLESFKQVLYTEEHEVQALGKRMCMRSEPCAAESSTPSCHHSEANSFPELDDVDLKELTNYNGLSNEDKAWTDDVEDASCSTPLLREGMHTPASSN